MLIVGCAFASAATASPQLHAGGQQLQLAQSALRCAGKAGGFLALDWQVGQATEELSQRSFRLHQQLAKSLGTDCGYRWAGHDCIEDTREG